MTFQPNGRLTATFPQSDLLPASGTWQMTAPHAFHYRFSEPILVHGKIVAFVQTEQDAYLTSRKTFEAAGLGAIYTAAHQPTGQCNIAQISARAL